MHTACIKKFFGTTTLPILDYTTEQLDQLALQIIQDQTSLTGVQPKLSLHLNEHEAARWLTKDELNSVKWLPADVELISHLRCLKEERRYGTEQ